MSMEHHHHHQQQQQQQQHSYLQVKKTELSI